MPKNRSKRLRKKLHIGEFQTLGFLIKFSLPDLFDMKAKDAFIDQFLAEAIEANGLFFGGSINKDSSGLITYDRYKSTTEAHRQLVKIWLSAQPVVTNIEIGELADAWQF